MKGKMKACVLTGKKELEWVEREIPQPSQGELQIKLEYVGICGSDLHFYEEGRLGNWELNGPLVLGHEPAGEVSAVGEGVEGFKVGDKVSIEPAVPCGVCEDCRNGHYNLCKNINMLAIPNEKNGVFSEYCVHEANMCYKLPEEVSTLEGAMIEPLTVGMHACALSNPTVGDSAIILGSGCIGLCTLLSLKARGVSEVYVVDVLPLRLEKAKELGATRVFDATKEDIVEFAKTLSGGGVTHVFECAGSRITTLQSSQVVKRAGKITIVGVSPEPILELDLATVNAMEATIYSVYRYRNLHQKAIDAVASGLINVGDIVTDFYDFSECIHAIEHSSQNKDIVTKGVIKFI